MIWLYRVLFPFGLLAVAPRYLWRMRRRGGYSERFGDRFGGYGSLPPRSAGRRRVWIQAVSVGEMLCIEPILRGLQEDGAEVFLTTTTSTGFRLAQERYGELVIGLAYFPIDWLPFSSRAWEAVRPDLAILTEGERWPEHLRQAAVRGVPTVCINGRISDRSFRRMKRFPATARLVLGGIGRLLAGSARDGERFVALGYPASRLLVTGNIKLDITLPPLDDEPKRVLRAQLGLAPGSLVLLGSSTWEGEEAALLGALRGAREAGIACSLLLVPRHAERRGDIESLLRATGLSFHLRSTGDAPGEVDVSVADTTGELRTLTQLADVVYVGKSLPPHTEGQTPVEAAALTRPILFGLGMGNFREIARDLVGRGAARPVADAEDLKRAVVELFRDEAKRKALASAASEWRRANAGAVVRTLAIVRAELGGSGGSGASGLSG